MRPVAVARQPHHLPGLAVDRQRLRTGDAAMGIEADHPRRHRCGEDLAAEQFLGADLGILRVGERRQRFWIDASLVLRERGGGADLESESKEERNEDGTEIHGGILHHTRPAWNSAIQADYLPRVVRFFK